MAMTITSSELLSRRNIEPGLTIIDVRTGSEFESSHISGAHNIPLAVVEQRLADVAALKAPAVLVCQSGARSQSALEFWIELARPTCGLSKAACSHGKRLVAPQPLVNEIHGQWIAKCDLVQAPLCSAGSWQVLRYPKQSGLRVQSVADWCSRRCQIPAQWETCWQGCPTTRSTALTSTRCSQS